MVTLVLDIFSLPSTCRPADSNQIVLQAYPTKRNLKAYKLAWGKIGFGELFMCHFEVARNTY